MSNNSSYYDYNSADMADDDKSQLDINGKGNE